jgi:hypothetical protein
MIIDFFQQILYSFIFFFGIAGVGTVILKWMKYEKKNLALDISIAFFASLCLYTILAAAFLFIVPDKLLFLEIFSILYFFVSFIFLYREYFKKDIFAKLKSGFLNNKLLIISLILALFVFFLQIYRTSIVDEWLHRPVVKFFTENGEFPLRNPLNPGENFIYDYHYGSYISASAAQLIFRDGVSESLDIFKLSYVIGTLLLFYGLIFHWSGRKKYALLGSVLIFFCGGSFFFLDGFTITYLSNVKWLEQMWTINAPLSYVLTGITYVNIPIIFAFAFLVEELFKKRIFYSINSIAIISVLIVGFFLISEFFAVILLFFIFLITAIYVFKKEVNILRVLFFGIIASLIIVSGIYFSGGVMGNIVKSEVGKFLEVVKIKQAPTENKASEISSDLTDAIKFPTKNWISLKKISEWGYPSENKIIIFKDHLFFYLRNLFLEAILIVLLAWALIKKKIKISDNYLLFFIVASGLVGPFIFSSSMADLNFAKLLNCGLVSLHLLAFYLFAKIESKKLFAAVLILFIFGAIPGMIVGSSIQWGIFKGKAREVRCSQNPLCYKNNVIEFLSNFEKENPGIKNILNKGGSDAQKIVDLTNSYSFVASKENLSYDYLKENKIGYILNDLESKDRFDVSDLENGNKVTEISKNGKYEILKINY